jgi:hypothetical protein
MAFGNFLGGAAQGWESGEQATLAQRKQAQIEKQQQTATDDKLLAQITGTLNELVKNTAEAGKDPRALLENGTVQSLIGTAQKVAQRAGYDPEMISNRMQAMVLRPPLEDKAEKPQFVQMPGTAETMFQPVPHAVLPSNPTQAMPIRPMGAGQPVLSPSETITPRQIQVANPLREPAQPASNFNERFAQQQPTVPVLPQAPLTAPGPSGVPPAPAGQRNEAMLNSMPENLRPLVKGIADYDIDIKSLSARAGERRQLLMLVKQYDPTFSMPDYSTIAATKKAFTSGVEARNLTSLGTVLGHIGDIAQASRALDNFKTDTFGAGTKAANAFRTWYLQNKQDPRVNAFETATEAVASELDRAFRGSTTAVTTIQGWHNRMKPGMSPEEIQANNAKLGSLLGSRINELVDQYERGIGPAANKELTLKMQAVKSKIEALAKGEGEGFISDAAPAATPKPSGGWSIQRLP